MFFKRKTKVKRPLTRRIINYFIGTAIAIIVILLLAFGYTQTSTFRDWLKDFVTEQVNSSTNGKLTIGGLDGTIFTSLILTSTVYAIESDTLFSADRIELKVSPLRIFLKTIYLRKLEIENADLNLFKYDDGELNVSKITAPSTEEEVKDTVTTSEPFSWKIDVADLKLKNFDFKHQLISNKNSTEEYSQPNMDDFRLENINLSLSAIANVAKNEFELYISDFSVKPNLTGFNLINLSGDIVLLNDIAGITDLQLTTDRSDISLNAAISNFSPFGEGEFKIDNSPIKLELDASKFNFDDLTNFISGTDLLRGTIATQLNAEGTLSSLELKNLKINFNETSLQASGFLQNIISGGDMMIETRFGKSFINQDDVNNLLHTIDFPVYKSLGVLEFDTLFFSGKPLDFSSGFALQTKKGRILGTVKMDLTGQEIVYDYRIKTSNLDVDFIAGVKTNLNLDGEISGKGFSPEILETSLNIGSSKSTIGEIVFNDLNIIAAGKDGLIKTDISFSSSETFANVNADFDFTDTSSTKYNFDIALKGFNVDDFVKETGLTTKLNLTLKGDGENFDQDRLNLFAVFQIDSSSINDIKIDSTTLIADIRSNEENRVINVISDLADLTITGRYTILEFIDVVSAEASLISASIQNKIYRIQPPKFNEELNEPPSQDLKEFTSGIFSDKVVNVQYLLELKSFELLSLFLGGSEIEVDGEISGRVFAQNDSVSIDIDTDIERLQFWDGEELYYISDFMLSLIINDKVSANSFDEFIAELDVKSKRFFAGSEINNLDLTIGFDKNRAKLDVYAEYDELATLDLSGALVVNNDDVSVLFNNFLFKYREFDLRNTDDIEFSYSNNKFNFQSFALVHNGGRFNLEGEFSLKGNEDLSVDISNFKLKDLSTNLLGISPEKSFSGELNLALSVIGTAENPVVKLDYTADSIKVQKLNLGSMESSVNYSDKELNIDLSFYETKNLQERHSLSLSGKLPIDLSLYASYRFPSGKPIDLNLLADNFDLRFLTGFLPGVANPNGMLNGNVKFSGPYDNILSGGKLSVDNASFVLEAINLKYLLDADFEIETNKILLSNLSLRNAPGIRNGGTINAYGEVLHENFLIEEIDMRASGDLKVMDESSRAVSPALYGDIAIKTGNEMVFRSTSERSYLSADLILKEGASITYSPAQSAFSNENDKFTYIFISADEEDLERKQIDSLIQLSQNVKAESTGQIPFDLDLKIQVENEAKMVFVLSREFKQNLTAYLGGNFEYKVVNNQPTASGELTLLDGSKLDFIKTFQAEGNVRFLDELANPYVNVLATYQSYYNPDTLATSGNEYDVQIRIRLEGPAKNLTTNFLRNEENIEVYKRRRGASQFELDGAKNASDAMFFIIVNKFPEDATLQESNLAVSTAASLAGSIVGNVLNERLGDVVRSVNVQQVGTETRVSLIGKVEEFRYELGGTSQVFQDLSRANVKIERPVVLPNLVIRFERREPSYQSATFSEMINELGLKYSFIF